MAHGYPRDIFHRALLEGNARAAIGMLDNGRANLGDDQHGRPPILLAVLAPDTLCLEILLERGFDPNQFSHPKLTTPAMMAARRGKADALAALIHAGCDLDARDIDGCNAPIWCAMGIGDSRDRDACLALMIKAGCDINARDHQGRTAAMAACVIPLTGKIGILKQLIEAGSEINAQDQRGWSAAMWACEIGRADCLALLIESGCDLDMKNAEGKSAGEIAAEKGHSQCIALIQEHQLSRLLGAVQAPKSSRAPGL